MGLHISKLSRPRPRKKLILLSRSFLFPYSSIYIIIRYLIMCEKINMMAFYFFVKCRCFCCVKKEGIERALVHLDGDVVGRR